VSPALRLALGTIAVVAAIAGCIVGALGLRELPRYRVDPGELRLRIGETLSDEGLRQTIPLDLAEIGERSIFDPGLLEAVAETAIENPWVRRVVRVERVYPSQVRVIVELRTPAALVRSDDGLWPIDRDGVRLPGKHASAEELEPLLPVIAGVEDVPAPGVGEPWRGNEVRMAFSVLDVVRRHGIDQKVRIHEVDVGIDERYRTRLVTLVAGVSGSRVLWGKSPLERDPADASDQQKVRNFLHFLDRYPGLQGLRAASVAGQVASIRQSSRELSRSIP
jgi:hypothetical protein